MSSIESILLDVLNHIKDYKEWIFTLCFGAVLLVPYSYSRFDEPSYDTQAQYFSHYKPRFSTSHARYERARWAYILAVGGIYIIFSVGVLVTPKDVEVWAKAGLTSPMTVAMAIVSLQNFPVLRDLERWIRGRLHAFAQIPEGVLRTIGQLRGSEFKFKQAALASLARRIGEQANAHPDSVLSNLVTEDEILRDWFRVGSVLDALSEQNRSDIRIDALFFEYYKDEFESIRAKHTILAEDVRRYLDAVHQNPSSQPVIAPPDEVSRQLHNIRDRLYTFVACGVRSSVKTDVENADILQRLGFVSQYRLGNENNIGKISASLVLALLVLSVFVIFSTELVRSVIGNELSTKLNLPKDERQIFLWFLASAVFYGTTIVGVLLVRDKRVGRREWFDLNDLNRRRPVLNYTTPTIVGTIFGSLTLLLIALFCGPGFETPCDSDLLSRCLEKIGDAYHWFPLAIVMAFTVLWISDTADMSDEVRAPWGNFLIKSVIGALILALTASFGMYGEGFVTAVGAARWQLVIANIFIPGQILMLAFVMLIIVQAYEYHNEAARRLIGRYIQAIPTKGSIFTMLLDPTGNASYFAATEKRLNVMSALSHGRWKHFPEGIVVQWADKVGKDGGCDLGLISSSGGVIVYEGFNERISGEQPDFVALLNVRVSPSTPEV